MTIPSSGLQYSPVYPDVASTRRVTVTIESDRDLAGLRRAGRVVALSLRGGEGYRGHRGITGESAVVTEEIEAGGKGMVRVGTGEFWTARSLHPDEKIERGTRVRVLDTDGLTALVDIVETKEEKS